ncbi:MAG: hypothetical protein FWF24_07800, partial [Alphaproteobacteria bacterium]|nr:hypothetical protein [Alphaproteobacteria bacterium]
RKTPWNDQERKETVYFGIKSLRRNSDKLFVFPSGFGRSASFLGWKAATIVSPNLPNSLACSLSLASISMRRSLSVFVIAHPLLLCGLSGGIMADFRGIDKPCIPCAYGGSNGHVALALWSMGSYIESNLVWLFVTIMQRCD